MSELTVHSQEVIDRIMKRVVDIALTALGDRLKSVILYGSYARGEANEHSDVDIFLAADCDSKDCHKIFSEKLNSCIGDIDDDENALVSVHVQSVHVFDKYKNADPYFRNIVEEGIIYYGV